MPVNPGAEKEVISFPDPLPAAGSGSGNETKKEGDISLLAPSAFAGTV